MTYHQLLYFMEKDYFLKFTSLKGQLDNKGQEVKLNILKEWARAWTNVNAGYLAQVGEVIRNSDEPPNYIDDHFQALNHGLRKFKPIERHPIMDAALPTEEEAQATKDAVVILKKNMAKIRNQKKMALDALELDSGDSKDKPVPEMVMSYKQAVETLKEAKNG